MTSDDTEAAPDTKTNRGVQKITGTVDNQDWFLSYLVNWADYYEAETAVTLSVGGQIISGIISSGKDYFEKFGEEYVSNITNAEAAKKMKELLASYGERYKKQKDGGGPSPPTYIHLRGARYFQSGGVPKATNPNMWWRGRISEVDGFSLGSLPGDIK